jgi:cytochrome c-type biogenesis protein CcmH/NrfG
VQQQIANSEGFFFLGEIYEKSGQTEKAQEVYQQARSDPKLHPAAQTRFGAKLKALKAEPGKR